LGLRVAYKEILERIEPFPMINAQLNHLHANQVFIEHVYDV